MLKALKQWDILDVIPMNSLRTHADFLKRLAMSIHCRKSEHRRLASTSSASSLSLTVFWREGGAQTCWIHLMKSNKNNKTLICLWNSLYSFILSLSHTWILLFSGLAAAGCKNIFPLDCWELVSLGDPVHSSNWFPLKPLQGIIFAIWQLPKTSRGWINRLMTRHVDCTCLHYHCDLKYLITSIALTIATIMKQTKPTGMMYDVWHVFLDQVKLIDALATFTIGPSWAMIASQLMGSSLTWCTHDHTWRPRCRWKQYGV